MVDCYYPLITIFCMRSDLRHFRLRLPRPLFDRLDEAARAAGTGVSAILQRIVAEDLRRRPDVRKPAGKGKGSRDAP